MYTEDYEKALKYSKQQDKLHNNEEWQAFLHVLAEKPKDSALHAGMADWLYERGHEGLAKIFHLLSESNHIWPNIYARSTLLGTSEEAEHDIRLAHVNHGHEDKDSDLVDEDPSNYLPCHYRGSTNRIYHPSRGWVEKKSTIAEAHPTIRFRVPYNEDYDKVVNIKDISYYRSPHINLTDDDWESIHNSLDTPFGVPSKNPQA